MINKMTTYRYKVIINYYQLSIIQQQPITAILNNSSKKYTYDNRGYYKLITSKATFSIMQYINTYIVYYYINIH